MKTSIDRQGRLVVPKPLRERLALRGGETLEIDEHDGHLEIRREGTDADEPLVDTGDGFLTMGAGPGLNAEQVRELLERTRR